MLEHGTACRSEPFLFIYLFLSPLCCFFRIFSAKVSAVSKFTAEDSIADWRGGVKSRRESNNLGTKEKKRKAAPLLNNNGLNLGK